MSYLLHLAVFVCIYVILAQSLNLIVGFCGMLSLAHAAFFALGAYTYALITVLGVVPPGLLAILAAGIAASISGLALAIPAWRLKGDFFVVISLGLQVLLFNVLLNWHHPGQPLGSWKNLTNGLFGIGGIRRPVIVGIEIDTSGAYLVFAAGVLVLVLGACWALTSSPWGRLLVALRDDELALQGLGKSPRQVKTQAIVAGAFMAGLAGAVYAGYTGYIDPTLAGINESVLLLSMLLVGGSGNIVGPAVGAAVLVLLPEGLRAVHVPDALAGELRLLAYGLLLVALMRMRPQGLAGAYRIE